MGRVSWAGGLLLLCSGCASIMTGGTQRVYFQAEDGAIAEVDGREIRGTEELELRRGHVYTVHGSRPGHARNSETLRSEVNGWIFGNLALGPFFPIGVLVDALSGAASSFKDERVYVHAGAPLRRSVQPVASAPASPAIRAPVGSGAIAAVEAAPNRPPKPKPEPKPQPQETAEEKAEPQPKPISSAHPQAIVAVVDMQGHRLGDLDEGTLPALTDQMRVYLAARGVRVVDRGAQQEALAELLAVEKGKSYAPCVDESCQIPLGKALAASHLLRSSVARFGTACTTNGELIDLTSELTIAAASIKSECTEEALLDASEQLAQSMLERF